MKFNIGQRTVGEEEGALVIAELSANHNQDYEVAVKTVIAAKEAGADAVKLQTYTPDTITIDADNEYFRIRQGTVWDGKTLYQLYKEAYTPWEWQPKLKRIAEDLGLLCFSSPFDRTAVDFLEGMNVPAYKVASFEITDIPLVEYIASKGRPVLISTGIATLGDIEEAVNACRRMGNDQIALLLCTSAYPASPEEMNLKTLPNLAETFGTVPGLSDHTPGIAVPVVAAALGAKIIEKHFILNRELGGPDAAFSLQPEEFKAMVDAVRAAVKALGTVSYELSEKARRHREFARSLFVVRDMEKGEVITEESVRSIRPGYGLRPKYLCDILGKKIARAVGKGTPLSWDLIGE